MRARGWRLLLAAICVVAALAVTAVAANDQGAAPSSMLDRLTATALPPRDPLDLAVRLRGVAPDTPLRAPEVAAPLELGYQETFWVLDQRTTSLFEVQATLRLVSDHAYWFVQPELADRAPQADLERSANAFETNTYPVIHTYFGSEPTPGVDGDPHIVFLLANVPGVAAYFSSVDAYPRAVNSRSNQHEMIYVNLNATRPGLPGFDSTLAHELEHMAHFARCPSQESWVDEGIAELASRVAGYEGGANQAFVARPDIQLNAWDNRPAELTRHYQAAYLFVRYVAERGGGWDTLPRLLATCARGEALFERFLNLEREPLAPSMDALFADWAVANLVNDPSVADGRFAYAGGAVRVMSTGSASHDGPFLGSLRPYAANYVELPTGTGSVSFSGDTVVPLFEHDGPVWWSNRGDSVDTRLTRRLDLRGLVQASARFRVRYDLEDKFDYVYLSASRDGGQTWQTLHGQRTESDRATGNNYGVGWSGTSPGWVDEEVDLTPVAGSEVLLSFDYVTDQSYSGEGFAFRDFEVPLLGLSEPGAPDGVWAPEGWLLVDGPVPERWILRLVRWLPDGIRVDSVPVGVDAQASFSLDPSASRNVLVVAPSAPRTLLPGKYQITVGESF